MELLEQKLNGLIIFIITVALTWYTRDITPAVLMIPISITMMVTKKDLSKNPYEVEDE